MGNNEERRYVKANVHKLKPQRLVRKWWTGGRTRGEAEEGVPLDAALPDVAGDEVLPLADVHLVPDLEVVRRLHHRLPGEHRVPCHGPRG